MRSATRPPLARSPAGRPRPALPCWIRRPATGGGRLASGVGAAPREEAIAMPNGPRPAVMSASPLIQRCCGECQHRAARSEGCRARIRPLCDRTARGVPRECRLVALGGTVAADAESAMRPPPRVGPLRHFLFGVTVQRDAPPPLGAVRDAYHVKPASAAGTRTATTETARPTGSPAAASQSPPMNPAVDNPAAEKTADHARGIHQGCVVALVVMSHLISVTGGVRLCPSGARPRAAPR